MYYCTHCGNQNADDAVFCNRCGTRLHPSSPNAAYGAPVRTAPVSQPDAPSGGFAALGFFIPLVGLILYCVWRNDFPLRANSAGKGALARVIASIALTMLILIVGSFFVFSQI